MKIEEKYSIQPDQLNANAAMNLLKKYNNTNFRELLDIVLDEEKPVIQQVLKYLKDTDKKNSYYESVGVLEDKPVKTIIPQHMISAIQRPFQKYCKKCNTPIDSGNYCASCAKGLAKENYGI